MKNPYENTLKKLQQLAQESRERNSGGQKIEKKETGKVSIAEAIKIMGSENFYGPGDVGSTFGFEVKNVIDIPFSKEELERAKELGQELIFYIDKTNNGESFTVKKMKELTNNETTGMTTLVASDWFETDSVASLETPRLGWRLSGKEPLKDSEKKNYIQQTEVIVENLKNEIFKTDMPSAYREAIEEFELVKESLRQPTESSNANEWKPAAEKLANLKINQMCRENYSEVLYRMALHEKKTGERLLDPTGRAVYYTWTNSRGSGGGLVRVGYFVSSGALVFGWRPGDSYSRLGVCFSRS